MENNDIIKIARAKAEKWLDKAYDEKTRAACWKTRTRQN